MSTIGNFQSMKKNTTLNITVDILIKLFICFIIIAMLSISFVYYEFNLRKRIVDDLSHEESEEIFEIIGLEDSDDLEILSFEALVSANFDYNLLVFPKKNYAALVNSKIADNCKQVSELNFLNKNRKLSPQNTLYCSMYYDEDKVYLSFRDGSYDGGNKLMDYFWKIYKKR